MIAEFANGPIISFGLNVLKIGIGLTGIMIVLGIAIHLLGALAGAIMSLDKPKGEKPAEKQV